MFVFAAELFYPDRPYLGFLAHIPEGSDHIPKGSDPINAPQLTWYPWGVNAQNGCLRGPLLVQATARWAIVQPKLPNVRRRAQMAGT